MVRPRVKIMSHAPWTALSQFESMQFLYCHFLEYVHPIREETDLLLEKPGLSVYLWLRTWLYFARERKKNLIRSTIWNSTTNAHASPGEFASCFPVDKTWCKRYTVMPPSWLNAVRRWGFRILREVPHLPVCSLFAAQWASLLCHLRLPTHKSEKPTSTWKRSSANEWISWRYSGATLSVISLSPCLSWLAVAFISGKRFERHFLALRFTDEFMETFKAACDGAFGGFLEPLQDWKKTKIFLKCS